MRKFLGRGILVFMLVVVFCPSFVYALAAPDFVLEDLRGEFVSLSKYNEKSVVLFFWTTWCPYCLKELEELNENYDNLVKEGVEVLAVNAGEPKRVVERFAKERNFPFRVLLDTDTHVSFEYGVMGIPTYVFIDKNGEIVRRGRYLDD